MEAKKCRYKSRGRVLPGSVCGFHDSPAYEPGAGKRETEGQGADNREAEVTGKRVFLGPDCRKPKFQESVTWHGPNLSETEV